MISKTESTFVVRIYSSGPIEVAKQALRLMALHEGMCVTIEPTLFIYTGGEEQGFVVGLLNYPRFPQMPSGVKERALRVARVLLEACGQHSILVCAQDETVWLTKRETV